MALNANTLLESASESEEEKPKSSFLDSLDFDEDEPGRQVCPFQFTLPRSKVNLLLIGMGAVVFIIFIALLVMIIASNPSQSLPPPSPPNFPPPPPPPISNPDDHGGNDVNLYRLPTNILPISYHLSITPDFDAFTFRGIETIDIIAKETTNTIVLNTAELNFSLVTLQMASSSAEEPTATKFDEKYETVIFTFKRALKPEEHAFLRISFVGVLNDAMHGFYRSSYQDSFGNLHWIAATQFEATDARRAFPCFDEPSFKAKFSISLIVPKDMVALSNMPPMGDPVPMNGDPTSVNVTFEPSVKMSTYLVCFVIGTFDHVSASTDIEVEEGGQLVPKVRNVTVWTPVGLADQGIFARDVAVQVLGYYEELFQIQYPIGKLDMVAIPDFAAGAMENWGLVTYRQVDLLFDPKTASASSMQRVAVVVAHEIAHQWFGNLVTGDWWGSLWLHEGFATFFESVSLDHFYKDWHMRDQMMLDQQAAMARDYHMETHPLEWNPTTPDMIAEMFDTITYSKGCSVLLQAETYLGENVFYEGLRIYLSTHKYSNARSNDLWSALDTAYNNVNSQQSVLKTSNSFKRKRGEYRGTEMSEMYAPPKPEKMSVVDKMAQWTYSPGFPVLSSYSIPDPLKLQWVIEQERFADEKESELEDPSSTSGPWWVPVWTVNSKGQRGFYEITETKTTVNESQGENKWIKLNAGQKGLYRVNYDDRNWYSIQEALSDNHDSLPELDRAGLINDALVLAKKGRLSYPIPLSLLDATLNGEDSYLVWHSALSELIEIGYLLLDLPCYGIFEAFMQQMIETSLEELSKSQTLNHTQQLLLSDLNLAGVKYRSQVVLNQSLDLFWNMQNESFDPNLRLSVYYGAIADGDRDEYFAVRSLYLSTSDAIEKTRLLRALCKTPRRYLIQFLLLDTLDPDIIRPQDRYIVFSLLAGNPLGESLSWDFFRENYDVFNKRGFGVGRTIQYITRHFSSKLRYEEVNSFFTTNPPHGGEMGLQASLETIKSNMKWISEYSDEVCAWFSSNSNQRHSSKKD